jgi:hypothetical protein
MISDGVLRQQVQFPVGQSTKSCSRGNYAEHGCTVYHQLKSGQQIGNSIHGGTHKQLLPFCGTLWTDLLQTVLGASVLLTSCMSLVSPLPFLIQTSFLTSYNNFSSPLLKHFTSFRGHHLILVPLQPCFCSSFPYICTLVTILPSRWRQQVLSKWWYLSTKLQSIISKRTVIFLEVMSDNFEGQKNIDIARRLV